MPQILKLLLIVVALNALYLGAHYLAGKIRKNSSTKKAVPFDEDKMKQDLLNERFEGCDHAAQGCGLQCPLAQYCNPRQTEQGGHAELHRD